MPLSGITTSTYAGENASMQSALCADFSKGSLEPNVGLGHYSVVRGGVATVTDNYGVVHNCGVNEVRYANARRVENLTDNSVQPQSSLGAVIDDFTDGVTRGSGPDNALFRFGTLTSGLTNDRYYSARIEVRVLSGSAGGRVQVDINGSGNFHYPVENLNDWTTIAIAAKIRVGFPEYQFFDVELHDVDDIVIEMRFAQLEEVTGRSNKIPSEYVPNPGIHNSGIDGVKYFFYNNGNTIVNNKLAENKGKSLNGMYLLEEEISTNLHPFSADVSSWNANSGVNVALDTESSPDGSPGYRMTEVGGTAERLVAHQLDVHSGDSFVFSVYLKAKERSKVMISVYSATAGYNHGIGFDLVSGAFHTDLPTNPLITEIATGCGKEKVAGGYYRLWMKTPVVIGDDVADFRVNMCDDDWDAVTVGNASNGMSVWGAQIEKEVGVTSYIPTAGVSVDREADVISKSSTVFSRLSSATVVDFEGKIHICGDNEARFQGARRVKNVDGRIAGSFVIPIVFGNEYAISMKGEVGATVEFLGGFSLTLTGIGSIARVSTINGVPQTSAASTANVIITGTISELMIEDVTGQSNQNPSEYVSKPGQHGANVDGVKYFPYKNGNTVDVNGVVTEARGSSLDVGYLNEAQATNLITYSENGSNWGPIGTGAILSEKGMVNGISANLITCGNETFSGFNLFTGDLTGQHIFSMHAKPGNQVIARLTIRNVTKSESTIIDFNSATGDINVVAVVGGTLSDFSSDKGSDGYRLSVNYEPTDPADSISLRMGTGTGNLVDNFYVTGVQLELEPTGSTSYIPTSGAAVTREADALSYTDVQVNGDFVAACDITPTISGSALNPDAGSSNHSMMANDDSRGNSNEFRTALSANAESQVALASIVLPTFANASLEQGVRNKFVVSEVSTGNGTEYKSVRQGAILFHAELPGHTLDHGNTGTWIIGGNILTPDKVSGLYHAFQLYDKKLTDEQLEWLSIVGNTPLTCR